MSLPDYDSDERIDEEPLSPPDTEGENREQDINGNIELDTVDYDATHRKYVL